MVVVVVVTSYYRTNLPTKINPKRFTEEKSAPLFKLSIGSRDPLLLLKARIDCTKAAHNAKAPNTTLKKGKYFSLPVVIMSDKS